MYVCVCGSVFQREMERSDDNRALKVTLGHTKINGASRLTFGDKCPILTTKINFIYP